ncbi:putative signaling protein [Acidithiobacillus ferridurans]|uniref:Putative signaling protein n=4 Tax=Acidithiobacillus ferridurans TaxID=1232575 RepID=A0A2Z6IHQ9_ACIFI|nr:EAL domain-containing protein [Acidithiobacillus ferridurans]BBF65258.1 putative signaling protein [Acidithiobacillus ferridurans]
MRLVFLGALLGILAFSSTYAWFSWHSYQRDSLSQLMMESDMVAQTTQRLLDGHASGLRFLGMQLQRADALHHPRRARTLLLDYQKATSGVASANLIALSGQVIASTAVPAGEPLPDFRNDPAIWPGFQKALQTHGMRIYHPLQGPLRGHWFIRLSHTVFSPAGKPLFVVATPLRFRDIEDFLRLSPLRPGTAVGLIRNDFYIEGRWPLTLGNLAGMLSHLPPTGALRHALESNPQARQGHYAGFVTVGQTYRVGAFTRLNHYPLTAFISIPRSWWLAAWWRRQVEFPLLFLIIMLGSGLAAYRQIVFLDRRWSEQREAFAQTLATQATHDILTGLPNREALRLVFDQALARADRQEQLLAVGFLDLDAFKLVNDRNGHAAGDDLLKEMARRLQGAVRRTDTVARLGGDEFVLLLEGLRGVDQLDQVLARLQTAMAQPFLIQGKEISLQASLGLTIYPFDGAADADLLLRHADQAMYAAKARPERGREGWVQLYHQDLGTITMGDEMLRQDFLQALVAGEVTLRYQPLVALTTGRVAGLEALARWRRNDREVSPDQFLPSLGVRERQALGHFVLQTGLRQLAQWRRIGLDIFLSVNVTPEELDSTGFADTVFDILAAQPYIFPESLVLEVLEIGEILEQEVALGHLQRLRSAGVKIALDDVGSAYASLLRLKNLPIDEIKIDQGFVRELLNKPQDLIFVESLINLGMGMNVIITVEGVETEEHIALLREMEVDYLQGYAIARPLEAEAVANFVHTFVLGTGDADTPLLALYHHLGWVHMAEESAMNHGGYEHTDLAACPITAWLHAHAPELPGVEALLAEHEAVHALGQEILRVRQSGTREELHRLLGQLHEYSHRFQEDLGRAVRAMRDNVAAS